MGETDGAILAVTGEPASLFLESDEPVTGKVKVSFEVMDEGESPIVRAFWDEELEAEPVTASAPYRSRIRWTVHLDGSAVMPEASRVVYFHVEAPGRTKVRSANYLRIPAFKITDNEKLHRIMIHEFSARDGDGDAHFDPAPLKAILDGLTPQQRKLLATTKAGPEGHRLVCFATLTPEDSRRMNADKSDPYAHVSIKPNASFTVFDCQGPGKDVTLVCHTGYMVLNMNNNPTRTLMLGQQNKKGCNEWLDRKTDGPPAFKIGLYSNILTHGVFYNRIFTANGVDVMKGNTVHGEINTNGCWMLFRNFNWPREASDKLDDVFIHHYRNRDSTDATVKSGLVEAGYDFEGKGKKCSSFDKFSYYDRNLAYTWFFHDVVGVRYFSTHRAYRYRMDNKFVDVRNMHDNNLDGKDMENTMDIKLAEDFIEANGDGPEKYAYYDVYIRRKTDKNYNPDKSLLDVNALGFHTVEDFIPPARPHNDLQKGDVDRLTWADLYLYKAEGLTLDNKYPRFYQV